MPQLFYEVFAHRAWDYDVIVAVESPNWDASKVENYILEWFELCTEGLNMSKRFISTRVGKSFASFTFSLFGCAFKQVCPGRRGWCNGNRSSKTYSFKRSLETSHVNFNQARSRKNQKTCTDWRSYPMYALYMNLAFDAARYLYSAGSPYYQQDTSTGGCMQCSSSTHRVASYIKPGHNLPPAVDSRCETLQSCTTCSAR